MRGSATLEHRQDAPCGAGGEEGEVDDTKKGVTEAEGVSEGGKLYCLFLYKLSNRPNLSHPCKINGSNWTIVGLE